MFNSPYCKAGRDNPVTIFKFDQNVIHFPTRQNSAWLPFTFGQTRFPEPNMCHHGAPNGWRYWLAGCARPDNFADVSANPVHAVLGGSLAMQDFVTS
jgi:hypothetical protein